MFLYLTPSCCTETQFSLENTDVQKDEHNVESLSSQQESMLNSRSVRIFLQSSFMDYLHNARIKVRECKKACRCWCAVYDGMDVMTDMPLKSGSSMLITQSKTDRSSSSVFSFAARRNSSLSDSDPDKATREKANLTAENAETIVNGFRTYKKEQIHSTCCLGPFMTFLYEAIENMMENSYYVNLHLTSLVSRLACYPQPILRSLLLNSNLVMQPGLKSLFQVIEICAFNHGCVGIFHCLCRNISYLCRNISSCN